MEAESNALTPTDHTPTALTLFRTDEPAEIVTRATAVADALAPIIDRKNLYSMIGGKKHVNVEGWTLLGTMLGVYPVCVWTKQIEGGFEARVEARTRDGSVVGAAECRCTKAEGGNWGRAADYALQSMATTRAVSKALRGPLGFVVALAGYAATPDAELVDEVAQVELVEESVVLGIIDYISELDADMDKIRAAYSVTNLSELTAKQADHLLKGLAKKHAELRADSPSDAE